MRTPQVIFVHGMFMTPRCWDSWVERFARAGYEGFAPAWPHHDHPVEDLRRFHPNAELGKVTLDDVVAHFEGIVRKLDAPPILIGHSLGGLVVQLLLSRGLGAAGVAISSAPPRGVFALSGSFLRSNWPIVNPLVSAGRPLQLTYDQFRRSWVEPLPAREQVEAFNRFLVPESRRVGRGTLGRAAKVDFKRPRAPLLLVAGTADKIIPPAIVRKNLQAYAHNLAVTDYQEFEGRTHFILGQEGWELVADFVRKWLEQNTGEMAEWTVPAVDYSLPGSRASAPKQTPPTRGNSIAPSNPSG
jgi:pimeloyl-ACP methyl ester carboxylesterase